ncbi:RnfABCDGE type electron transport complex subunit D [Tumebacillus permanentifrigoris]|uniref:NQR2/RnfD/RnfE family subunit of NADH-ubiquinone oxidoreductase n=1 Tax=Tumebacillus permanentifrigoris TaxID=378543 RepID=A0A316DE14_9BACL|nr:RnfABCDGE type electron transport complex subunit D [Tumebacillus permanentifrigoris]PWK16451.1 NQR2/RnfD/RnfE family subunit of NADH-ubiquinone oxidoreductase [Tumebacillus permanentifrigoris]
MNAESIIIEGVATEVASTTEVSTAESVRRGASYWATPKAFVMLVLLALVAIGLGFTHNTSGLINAGAAVASGVLIDLIFGAIQKRKRAFPDGALLTGLIVTMVLSATTPWYMAAGATAVGVLAKHLLKVKKKPILNPAAVGLLLALLLLQTDQDWWGGMSEMPAWCTGFLVVGGLMVTRRVHKYASVLTFLGVYVLSFLGLALAGIHSDLAADALRLPFINSALFLSFLMLTDPPTSPAKGKDQVLFGLIAAVVSIGIYLIWGGLSYLLIGLLVANLWNAWRLVRR